MALRKYDMANSEQFITPVRGLYPEHSISIEEFKARNAGLLKNRWIETIPVNKGEKIYELYELGTDGELVKESIQEWLWTVPKYCSKSVYTSSYKRHRTVQYERH